MKESNRSLAVTSFQHVIYELQWPLPFLADEMRLHSKQSMTFSTAHDMHDDRATAWACPLTMMNTQDPESSPAAAQASLTFWT